MHFQTLFHSFRYKDGVPIQKNSTYKISNYNLIISDVQLKHAGVFTVSVGNQAVGLHRNLSYTLVVNGEPETHLPISERNRRLGCFVRPRRSRLDGR